MASVLKFKPGWRPRRPREPKNETWKCVFRHRWGQWTAYQWEGYHYIEHGWEQNWEIEKREVSYWKQKRVCERCGVTQDVDI